MCRYELITKVNLMYERFIKNPTFLCNYSVNFLKLVLFFFLVPEGIKLHTPINLNFPQEERTIRF